MLSTILTLLAIYGVCFSIKDTKLFSIPRNWLRTRSVIINELLSCSFCIGFWSGLVVHFVTYKVFDIKDLFLFGFGGSALCYIVDTIIIWFEEFNNKKEGKLENE